MGAAWEQIDCAADSLNQGYGKCVLDFGMLNHEIGIPKGEIIPASALADFENYLRTKLSDPNPAKRWYLSPPFVTYEQKNTDAQSQTAGNGLVRFTNVGQFGWDVQVWDGGWCAYQNMLKWHQSQDRLDFLNIHGGTVVAGVLTTDATGAPAMKGISMMQVFTPNWTGSDGGANGTKYLMSFRVGDAMQMRKNYTAMKFDFDITSMPMIIDVDLSITAAAPNYDILAVTGCGGEDLSQTYGLELSSPAAWVVMDETSGTTIVVTSVHLVGNKFRFVLSTTPTSGHIISFSMAPVDQLDTLGIIGYESNVATIKA